MNRYLRGPAVVEPDGCRCPVVDYGEGNEPFPFGKFARCTSVNAAEDEALIVLPGNDHRPTSGFPGWTEINEATYVAEFTTNEGRAPEEWEK